MAIDERTRRDLYTVFEESWGAERAEALMSLLPPVGWGDVATRQDLDRLRDGMDAAISTNAALLRIEMAGLRTEMADLRTEIADLRTEFHRDLAAATRIMVFSLTSSVLVVGSLAFAAATLV